MTNPEMNEEATVVSTHTQSQMDYVGIRGTFISLDEPQPALQKSMSMPDNRTEEDSFRRHLKAIFYKPGVADEGGIDGLSSLASDETQIEAPVTLFDQFCRQVSSTDAVYMEGMHGDDMKIKRFQTANFAHLPSVLEAGDEEDGDFEDDPGRLLSRFYSDNFRVSFANKNANHHSLKGGSQSCLEQIFGNRPRQSGLTHSRPLEVNKGDQQVEYRSSLHSKAIPNLQEISYPLLMGNIEQQAKQSSDLAAAATHQPVDSSSKTDNNKTYVSPVSMDQQQPPLPAATASASTVSTLFRGGLMRSTAATAPTLTTDARFVIPSPVVVGSATTATRVALPTSTVVTSASPKLTTVSPFNRSPYSSTPAAHSASASPNSALPAADLHSGLSVRSPTSSLYTGPRSPSSTYSNPFSSGLYSTPPGKLELQAGGRIGYKLNPIVKPSCGQLVGAKCSSASEGGEVARGPNLPDEMLAKLRVLMEMSSDSALPEEIIEVIPVDDEGKKMSLGSIYHESGTCKPCVFYHNPHKGCNNGTSCRFCHFQHAPKRRLRLSRKKRAELQAAAAAVKNVDADSDSSSDQADESKSNSTKDLRQNQQKVVSLVGVVGTGSQATTVGVPMDTWLNDASATYVGHRSILPEEAAFTQGAVVGPLQQLVVPTTTTTVPTTSTAVGDHHEHWMPPLHTVMQHVFPVLPFNVSAEHASQMGITPASLESVLGQEPMQNITDATGAIMSLPPQLSQYIPHTTTAVAQQQHNLHFQQPQLDNSIQQFSVNHCLSGGSHPRSYSSPSQLTSPIGPIFSTGCFTASGTFSPNNNPTANNGATHHHLQSMDGFGVLSPNSQQQVASHFLGQYLLASPNHFAAGTPSSGGVPHSPSTFSGLLHATPTGFALPPSSVLVPSSSFFSCQALPFASPVAAAIAMDSRNSMMHHPNTLLSSSRASDGHTGGGSSYAPMFVVSPCVAPNNVTPHPTVPPLSPLSPALSQFSQDVVWQSSSAGGAGGYAELKTAQTLSNAQIAVDVTADVRAAGGAEITAACTAPASAT